LNKISHLTPNKLLNRLLNFVEKFYLSVELLIIEIDNKISLLPIWCYIAYCSRSIESDVCWCNQRK